MKKFISIFILACFIVTGQLGTIPVYAQEFRLPAPGVMVRLSPAFNPPILKGIKVHPDDPFRFDFVLDKGDGQLSNDSLKNESSRLIKYFLASLTIPEKDLWVNLSPYEKDRIIPRSFGLTEMGRDLLAEDYMLKQITASLIYPEGEIGKKFWKRIYEEAGMKYGTTNIPVNTFNKVWIIPEKAVVYENAKAGAAYVVESKLKVMLEQDYLSLKKHEGSSAPFQIKETNQLGSDIVREIVIPELTTEVNENKNFSHLRQIYNSLILATWYKAKIKDSILSQVYSDQNKIAGVSVDTNDKERIYGRYLAAFKKGCFNYIKEDFDALTQRVVPRKYFSGGMAFDKAMTVVLEYTHQDPYLDHLDRVMQVKVDMGMIANFIRKVRRKIGGRSNPTQRQRPHTGARTSPNEETESKYQHPLGEARELYEPWENNWLGYVARPRAAGLSVGIMIHVDITDPDRKVAEHLYAGVAEWLRDHHWTHKVLAWPSRWQRGTKKGKSIAIYPDDESSHPLKSEKVRQLCEELDNYIIRELKNTKKIRESPFRADGLGSDRLFIQADGSTSGRIGIRFGSFNSEILVVDRQGGLSSMVFDNRGQSGQGVLSLDLYNAREREALDRVIGIYPLPPLHRLSSEKAFSKYALMELPEQERYIRVKGDNLMEHFKRYGSPVISVEPKQAGRSGTRMFSVTTKSSSQKWLVKVPSSPDEHKDSLALMWLKEFIITQTMKNISGQGIVANDPIGFLRALDLNHVADQLAAAYEEKDWKLVFEIMREHFTVQGDIFLAMPFLSNGEVLDVSSFRFRFMSRMQQKKIVNSLKGIVDLLHQHGIYHRDLKLLNFMVMKNGEVCLLDFETAVLVNVDGEGIHFSRYVPMVTRGFGFPYQQSLDVFEAMNDQERQAFLESQDNFSIAVIQEVLRRKRLVSSGQWENFSSALLWHATVGDLFSNDLLPTYMDSVWAHETWDSFGNRQSALEASLKVPVKNDPAMKALFPNRAMNAKGGIDLSQAQDVLKIGHEAVKFHIDKAMLQEIQNASGFEPMIISIQPMTDLRQFLAVPSD